MHIKGLFGVVPIALVVALAGCGGAASGGGASAGNAGDTAKAQALIAETFGPNPAASSGMLNGTIDITVTGVPRLKAPISLSMSGPFKQTGSQPPEEGLSLGITVPKGIIGADMYLVGNEMLIGVGSSAYKVPDSIAGPIRAPLADSHNALAALLAVFDFDPTRWVREPRIIGNETLAGVDVIHGSGKIDPTQLFLDAAKLTKLMTTLGATKLAVLPQSIPPAAQAALVRSVTSATGELYTGAKDHVMRKAVLNLALTTSPADRKLLGGISTMRVVGNLNVSDVGAPEQITPPPTRRPYSELQGLLNIVGAGASSLVKQGKY